MYAPYVVPHHPHIPYLGYLHRPSNILPYYMLTDDQPKSMSEKRSNRRNRKPNKQKSKSRYVMSKREVSNQDLVLVSVDG